MEYYQWRKIPKPLRRSRLAEVSAVIAFGVRALTLQSTLDPRPPRRYHYLFSSYLPPRHAAHPPPGPSWLDAFRRSQA